MLIPSPNEPLVNFDAEEKLPLSSLCLREARGPVEHLAPGSSRDDVALLVASRADGISHHSFSEIGNFLASGDVLVVNDSATLPAALTAQHGKQKLRVHISSAVPNSDRRLVEFRLPAGVGSQPISPPPLGARIKLPGDGMLTVVSGPLSDTRDRLREATLSLPCPLSSYLEQWGEPIRYSHLSGQWPLDAFQTVFARVPGGSEMPSAGRPFSRRLVERLRQRGVSIVPITLHTGVASQERGEAPAPEPYEVRALAAARINAARESGSRVIATGTSVVRALESCVAADGCIRAKSGMATLVVESDHVIRAVNGLITGWHDADATHISMLEALAGPELIHTAYIAASNHGYRRHEFGDSNLILV